MAQRYIRSDFFIMMGILFFNRPKSTRLSSQPFRIPIRIVEVVMETSTVTSILSDMKTVPVTVPLLLWLALSVMPVPVCGQNDAMAEFARRSWADIYPVKSQTNMRIDRVTVHGDLVVYEQFKPASFIIIHRGKDGFILAGYSFGNVFFGGEASGGRPYEILDAVAGACLNDTLRQKGGHNLQTEIGPLLHTRWGQGACFNYFCPRDPAGPGGRVWAGCLAVAMGQIVRYYGKYNSFDFTHEYQSGIYGQLSARLGNYRWEAMDDQPVTIGLEESDLVGDLGVLMHLCYGPSGSTGNSRQALDAFHAIGYAGASMLRKSKFTPESWAEIFYQNLSDYKPMMVTGGGHAFVCDGFDAEGLFHFNLGWDGYGDGWYPLNMVMNLPVNEVFADLEPLSWPAAPDRIGLSGTGDEATIRWNYESGQQPTRSRVYSDDRMVLETTDSLIHVGELSPGLHDIFVSAVYDTLESRWIGPVRVFVTGKLLVVHDQLLYRIFLKELGRTLPDIQLSEIFEGDLSRIESIEIDQPVLSMEDMVFCNHLKRLVIDGFPGPGLDAGPLENLSRLKILEWNGRQIIHQESLSRLTSLTELILVNVPLRSLSFLEKYSNLLKFGYSNAPLPELPDPDWLPLIENLTLQDAELEDARFISKLPNLVRLNLSGNQISETSFLSPLSNLADADLSENRIANLLLTDRLQSLKRLDVSGNRIGRITITSELMRLTSLNISNNLLRSPGRLFIYTPNLVDLDLSGNKVRDMGNQRCSNMEAIDASDNQLITVEWL